MADRLSKQMVARRAAAELMPGIVASLGPGLPGLVAAEVSPERGVTLHCQNGLLGYGSDGNHGTGIVDAGGHAVGLLPGASILNQADSFGVIRGAYVDAGVVEAVQVSQAGDIATDAGTAWGPMELASSAKRLIAVMEHTTADGNPRIVSKVAGPAVAGCVDLIVTDAAVIEVSPQGLLLKELAPGWGVDDVRAITGAALTPSSDLKEMDFSQPRGQPASKVYGSAEGALADVPDGAVILMDGFGGPGGMAQYLIIGLRDQGARGLTLVSNTAGIARVANFGTPPGYITIDHSLLVDSGQVRKAVASFPVSPSASRPSSFEQAYRRGDAELELVPQGTLAERIRAGGFGVGAFYTPTGAGTQIAEGKRTLTIDGREQILEYGIRGDYALIRAHVADTMGNLVYKGTSRNFNAVMAPAAAITIAEVDEIVEPGQLDPDAVVTPGIFVQRIVRRPPDFSPYERMG